MTNQQRWHNQMPLIQQTPDDEDVEAWHLYPHYRLWANKLFVAEEFGYKCGPAGVPVPKEAKYIVRPIMNLAGMGVGARILTLAPEEIEKVPAGYFWCEVFTGQHLSIDYVKKDNYFHLLNAYEGINSEDDLTRFRKWTKLDCFHIFLPEKLKKLDVPRLNIETIDGNVIEVHLRNGFDHMMQYEEIIPVFKGDPRRKSGYKFVEGLATGYGSLLYPREGYLVR